MVLPIIQIDRGTHLEDRGYILVLEYIKELIISGNLSVGDKLPTERKLSETLSLSRNTIRDAIRIMAIIYLIKSVAISPPL